MTRKQESITLSISEEEKAELEKLSLEFGCYWGDKPNISKLFKQVANGDIILSRPDVPKDKQASLIKQAIALIQRGLTILIELI